MITDRPFNGDRAVIIGTAGKSPLIDKLIYAGKIKASDLSGKREKFIITVVDNPVPGIGSALVITGSDIRGTIYGMYHLSKKMGVSPWYWWADVPVKTSPGIYIGLGQFTLGEPKVRCRGLAFNKDDPQLKKWVMSKFGSFNKDFYDKVCELVLRLNGNYLQPAAPGNSLFIEEDDVAADENPGSTAVIYDSEATGRIESFWLQMTRAYQLDFNKLWILNAEGIKHQELLVSFWFELAWDPENMPGENLEKYYVKWAAEQFGSEYVEKTENTLYRNQQRVITSETAEVLINAVNYSDKVPASFSGYLENSGYISIEASEYQKSINSNGIYWQTIKDFGLAGSAVTPLPADIPRQQITQKSPRLEYSVYTFTGGKSVIHFYMYLDRNWPGPSGPDFGISVDDRTVQIINMQKEINSAKAAGTDIIIVSAEINPGKPGPHQLKYWMIDPGIVLQKIVIDTGGLKQDYPGPPQSFYKK